MSLNSRVLFIIFSLVCTLPVRAATLIRFPGPLSEKDSRFVYDREVLDLLLKHTEKEFGAYRLVAVSNVSQARAFEQVRSGQLLDLMIAPTSKERESELLPIRHCTQMNLIGTRLPFVRQSSLPLFRDVATLGDLGNLMAGQGMDWPDTALLRAHGLSVATGRSYSGLFKMLQANRFQYFPRSVSEIWDEALLHADKGLVVEPNLVLVYNMPSYIFVNKTNTALAKRLKLGWEMAMKDGSFEALFLKVHGESIRKARLKERRVIPLGPVPEDFERLKSLSI